ncbi:MAG: DNA phosphorothioation-associated putative methyltransferase [Roseomonas sp.]|nr:DNA phosphorothioation-associated putative methyltransferase [Roseomonas sp.]
MDGQQPVGMGPAAASLHAAALTRLEGGKRVGDHVYMHVSLLAAQDEPVRKLVEVATALAGAANAACSVVRIARSRPEVALLDYPDFFTEAFPTLRASWVVDLATERATAREFIGQANPPILHRKELLLPDAHPAQATFAVLTSDLEDYGAFDQPANLIGRQVYWQQALANLGLCIHGHSVAVADPAANETARRPGNGSIARHRTAISRRRLSTPMQALVRWGLIGGDTTVLDYGCGRGDDVRTLKASGISAAGWDPHFASGGPIEAADIVNLGFVLNVIEDQDERAATLRRAFSLTRRTLCVAVMQPGDGRDTAGRSFADGVVTRRATFQRYFEQTELCDYVSAVLGREPVSVGPGIVFVFASDEHEQSFLARRRRGALLPSRLYADEDLLPVRAAAKRASLYERHRELLDAFWATVLELGRMPESADFGRWDELAAAFKTTRRAFDALDVLGKAASLADAAKRRSDDLLVHLALNLFDRRRSSVSLPPAILRDIRGFFGSHKSAMDRAKAALFESGSGDWIAASTEEASAAGLGARASKDGDYTFHASLVDEQPVPIRILIGCAEQLEPLPSDADLLKIHGSGTRVSYLRFDGFDARPIPLLANRVVVDLRRRRVDEMGAEAAGGRRTLVGKARLMPPAAPGRERQARFDQALQRRGVFAEAGLGPPANLLAKRLRDAGIAVPMHSADSEAATK